MSSEEESVIDQQDQVIPLCVDLDGTLIRTDLFVESLFALLKINFFYVFLVPLWLLKGKAHMKQQIAEKVDLDISLLPYTEAFIIYLKEQQVSGRKIILVTATNSKYASAVAEHVGMFDEVLASTATNNLAGHRKSQVLVEKFGPKGFDYAGNAKVDLAIWAKARYAIVVNPEAGVKARVEGCTTVSKVIENKQSSILAIAKALRLHQWVKNLLLFVPLILAHKISDLTLVLQALMGFFAFGLCASSIYLLNDLFDLPDDRKHDTKCNRPFASGTWSIKIGAALIPILLVVAVTISYLVKIELAAIVLIYFVVALIYSYRLKQIVLIDVLVLAGLYTVRIIAGAVAVSVVPSFWLLAFSMFLFFSLALVKRYAELLIKCQQKDANTSGRGYYQLDLEGLAQFGTSSGFMAVLVLALYINSEQVFMLYQYPKVIWLLCPLVLYWNSRVWLLARRNEIYEDPVVFTLRDKQSHWLALIGLAVLWIAT